MKLFKKLFLVALACMLLTGCGAPNPAPTTPAGEQAVQAPNSAPATPEDEQAIQAVIQAYDRAYYLWDMEVLSQCVIPEYPLEDTEMMLRNALGVYVEQGDIVSADIEKFLEIERKYYRKGAEQLQYRGWNITVSGNDATALVTYGYPNVDANMPTIGEALKQYRDNLFISLCGMDEATAKANLSPEKFSDLYLQVTELDYAKRSENVSYVEDTIELRMQKVDGKWYIAQLVLPEE